MILIAIGNKNRINAQTPLTYDQKYAILKEVFDNVFMSMGVVDAPPELLLDDKRSSSVAYLKRNKDGSKTLAVEDKAFDICMTFGDRSKEALALLIGHELGHFRYNHQWGKDFSSSFALADIEDKLAEANTKLSELKYFETQADHSGGVSCYLAGYDISGLGEPLLKKIYTEYELPSESPKYPSLKDRISLSQQNDSIIGKLIRVFETGNYAMLVGEYGEAIKCFEFVLNKGFKSREMYNNLGACALLKAIGLIGKEKVKYVYPVEIDVESRIKDAHKGFSDEAKGLLTKAKDYFKIAVQLDKNYSTGYINLACAHSLDGELEDGKYNASKALKILSANNNDPTYLANANIVMAILLDQESKTNDAKNLLSDIIKVSPNYLAEVNLEIIKGKKAEDFTWAKKMTKERLKNIKLQKDTSTIGNPARKETIAGINDFMKDLEGQELDEIEMNKSSCYYLDYKNSEIYNLTTTDNHELYFQETTPNYIGQTSQGITFQNAQNKIIAAYGLPDVVYTSRGENIFIYKSINLMIKLCGEKVSGWIVYRRY